MASAPPWPLVPLGTLFDHVDERSTAGDERLLSISKNFGVVPRDTITDAPPRAATLIGYKRCVADDLVVNQMSVYDGLLGRAPIAGIVTYHYLVFRPRPRTDTRYFAYLLKSPLYMGDFGQRVRGLGEINQANVRTPHIRISDFLQTVVPCPPYEEQVRIADYLDGATANLDRAMNAKHDQIALLNEFVGARIDTFIEADASDFGWIPLRRWILGLEQGWSPQCEAVPAAPDEYGVLKLSAVRDGRFKPEENKAMTPGESPAWRYVLRRGDLLVSRANTPDLVGDSAVVDVDSGNLFLSDLLYRVDLSVEEPVYVSAALRSRRVRGLLRVLARGTSLSMAKIRGDDIKGLPVPNAPVHVRRQRAAEIEELESFRVAGLGHLAESISLIAELRVSTVAATVLGDVVPEPVGSQESRQCWT